MQLRQHTTHKRTLLAIEGKLTQRNTSGSSGNNSGGGVKGPALDDAHVLGIQQMRDGIDVYFDDVAHAHKFSDWVCAHAPCRKKSSVKVVSKDVKSNKSNSKHTICVTIAPLCRDDLVVVGNTYTHTTISTNTVSGSSEGSRSSGVESAMDSGVGSSQHASEKSTVVTASESNGGPAHDHHSRALGHRFPGIWMVHRVSSVVHLIQVHPPTMTVRELNAEQYWKHAFDPFKSSKDLTPFMIIDIEDEAPGVHGGGSDSGGVKAQQDEEEEEDAWEMESLASTARSTKSRRRTTHRTYTAREVTLARLDDMDAHISTFTHLGGPVLGEPGDVVMAYDLERMGVQFTDSRGHQVPAAIIARKATAGEVRSVVDKARAAEKDSLGDGRRKLSAKEKRAQKKAERRSKKQAQQQQAHQHQEKAQLPEEEVQVQEQGEEEARAGANTGAAGGSSSVLATSSSS